MCFAWLLSIAVSTVALVYGIVTVQQFPHTTTFFKFHLLAGKLGGICILLVIPENSVRDRAYMLKPDELG